MGLFQKSVLRKYLASQDAEACKAAYDLYVARFHDPHLQAQIGIMNEVEYQDGFLTHLFVNILGYTKRPDEGYNLVREKKNETDGKKADGAILRPDGSVIAVIELKGAKIKDLDKIDDQAWGYQRSHINCPYVITSNFEKLRFFIDNAVEHEEFNLFTLTQERFSQLWLCLQKDNLQRDLPKKVKVESLLEEEKVTKLLYKDYSAFKSDLWHDMCQQNPEADELELYKKSQKLLDRFLFIFFAEDKGLLPPNSITQIVKDWVLLKDLDAYCPLYDRIKLHFGYINTGRKEHDKEEIYAYNGGLFRADPLLDDLTISDDVLEMHVLKLTEYDFDTEVDTNILGHIFEHSLNDIENVRAELAGEKLDKSKTKRKKDGVFYTPKYITKYIVDNTVGKLCEEKKAEIGIEEEEFTKGRKGRRSDTLKKLDEQLKQYREWLLQVTICDPACGSGAFLNQTLEFLMAEHRYIDELENQLLGYAMVFQDVENHILERNIFGVDINEESVEIARLSLWLRTAQKGRKLTSLSDNIKVGNSLIDDPEVAGELAFKWQEQFPTVFNKGGFDVVIGNPPYGAKISRSEITWLVDRMSSFGLTKAFNDTYISFYIHSISDLTKERGILGFIAPNTWRLIDSGAGFRKYFLGDDLFVMNITQHTERVFMDATVDVDSVFIKKDNSTNKSISIVIGDLRETTIQHTISQNFASKQASFNVHMTEETYQVKQKVSSQSFLVGDWFDIKNGIKPYERGKGKPAQTSETLKEKPFTSEHRVDSSFSPLIGGSSFHKYRLLWNQDLWIKYGEWLAAPRDPSIFDADEKLIFRQTSDKIIGTLITDGYVMRNNTHMVLKTTNSPLTLKTLLVILNSRLVDFFYWTINPERGEALAEVKAYHLGLMPFPKNINDPGLFDVEAEGMLKANDSLIKIVGGMIQHLQSKFDLPKPSTKLKHWPSLDFKSFLAELKKNKVKLSLEEEAEWLTYFNKKKTEANALQAEIDGIDKQINQMVYELYGLSEEEINVVEAS